MGMRLKQAWRGCIPGQTKHLLLLLFWQWWPFLL